MNNLKIYGSMEGGGQAGREKDGENLINIQDARVSEKAAEGGHLCILNYASHCSCFNISIPFCSFD